MKAASSRSARASRVLSGEMVLRVACMVRSFALGRGRGGELRVQGLGEGERRL